MFSLKSDAPLRSAQLALTPDVENQLIETLQDCDRKWYYIFAQDYVSGDDFKTGEMSKLQKRISGAEKGAVVEIPEVVMMEHLSAEGIQDRLEKACSARGKKSVDCRYPSRARRVRSR